MSANRAAEDSAGESTYEIGIEEFAERLNEATAVFDVRNNNEYLESHLPGSINVSYPTPTDRELQAIREAAGRGAVYFICNSGYRSFEMTKMLRDLQVEVISVDGGLKAWVRSGRPLGDR
ncbi:rhodanese-like domain-containing protein [Nesterenkonia salmonea]|uniref:Rhodanese-like domain-containing protein n=1 Tax=Nesterenkonia salmonea TaxID=1804987 RepID=A0A5R9B781_9MICC|nr:rhodanese-like domain-containing protein [Nesterenkonia salmonea]TLP92381.1 rhodanese-like domain-containing protein [Nesterenkonia salmonea]